MSAIWNILNFYPDRADPRTANLFLMSSPWPPIIIIAVYIKFSTDWGPKWMQNRKAFQINRIVQIFDVFQIVTNIYMVYKGLTLGWLYHYSWRCEPVDYSWEPRAVQGAEMVHFYFVVKITDLLDTVFFVLRKKQNQVTLLHVYHHASMVLLTWFGCRFYAGGHGTFFGLQNAFIHAIMYSHYFVMSLNLGWEPWWKRHITELQIVQFLVVLYHSAQLWWVEDCGYPKWPGVLSIVQSITFLWMFGKFYYYTYVKTPNKKKQKEDS